MADRGELVPWAVLMALGVGCFKRLIADAGRFHYRYVRAGVGGGRGARALEKPAAWTK